LISDDWLVLPAILTISGTSKADLLLDLWNLEFHLILMFHLDPALPDVHLDPEVLTRPLDLEVPFTPLDPEAHRNSLQERNICSI
jgi:hypothetical protein